MAAVSAQAVVAAIGGDCGGIFLSTHHVLNTQPLINHQHSTATTLIETNFYKVLCDRRADRGALRLPRRPCAPRAAALRRRRPRPGALPLHLLGAHVPAVPGGAHDDGRRRRRRVSRGVLAAVRPLPGEPPQRRRVARAARDRRRHRRRPAARGHARPRRARRRLARAVRRRRGAVARARARHAADDARAAARRV